MNLNALNLLGQIDGQPPYSPQEEIIQESFGGPKAKDYTHIAVQLERRCQQAKAIGRQSLLLEGEIILEAVNMSIRAHSVLVSDNTT